MQTLTKTIEWWWFDGDESDYPRNCQITIGMVDKKKSLALPQTNSKKHLTRWPGPKRNFFSSSNHPFSGTPPKFNIEPENDGLEDDFPFLGVYSQVPC